VARDLEGLVAKQDVASVSEYIAKNDLKWVESGYFDLTTEQIPGLNSAELFKASLELTKQNPVGKYLVREGDAQYVIKLVDAKTTRTDSGEKEADQRQKSLSGYAKWVSELRKTSKVSTNQAVLQ
jgi:hypothetical protein